VSSVQLHRSKICWSRHGPSSPMRWCSADTALNDLRQ
jgi:hypothetical protein